ncbi:MAG TPA: hypothetical protein DCS93_02080 [Microscillaceae bacterium]|nr:hypothetical protein [Microscillaceae bacterium]
MKTFKAFFGFLVVLLLLMGCESGTPKNGMKFKYEGIRFQKEIIVPEGKITEVEIFEHWVILHYEQGKKFIINRDKVWSITGQELVESE